MKQNPIVLTFLRCFFKRGKSLIFQEVMILCLLKAGNLYLCKTDDLRGSSDLQGGDSKRLSHLLIDKADNAKDFQ